jgi:hypothetical protein
MANDSQLLAALQAAHEAGDEDSAIKIAQEMAAQQPTHEPIAQNASGAPMQVSARRPADPSAGGSTLQFGKFDTGIPTSQGVDRFLSGAGQSFADTGRGISQLFGGQTQADTDEQRRLDAPLDRTGAGMAGNVAGGIAQYALPGMGAEAAGAKIASQLATNPGALRAAQAIYRIASPGATGAAFGASAPVGTGESLAGNAGRGAVAGEVGGMLGNAGSTVLRAGEDALSRGARIGSDIAKKYNIPLSMPPLAGGFTGWVGSALDKLPFSGAPQRVENQRNAFNSALGDVSGIDTSATGGPMDMESWQRGRQQVGSNIGAMAQGTTAFVTPAEITGVNDIIHDANTIGTSENAKIVNSWADRLFGPGSKAIPIYNPLPGGPVMQIPGDAWRAQNSALTSHISRTDDGDLTHYLTGLQGHYMDSLEHGMPPDKFDMFQDLRRQYSNAMTLRPLVEKAGSAGVNPNLVQNRALTAGKAFGPNGQPSDLGELGQLGKEQLTSKYADSGTAQRAMIYGTGIGLAGAGANALLGGGEENQNQNTLGGALAPVGGMIAGGLLSRAMHSRPVSSYYTSRLPPELAKYVTGAASAAPAAAAAGERAMQPAAPEPAMADGGQVDHHGNPITAPSFWDLVKTAWHEATTPDDTNPASIPVGGATGQAASQIEAAPHRIMDAADAQS